MADIVTILINGTVISSLYALVAIGFTMIFGVGGTINLAHGGIITVGAFSAYYVTNAGLGIWAGVLAAMAVPALFSVLLYKGFAERRNDIIIVMILTLLASIVVEEVVRIVEGASPRRSRRSSRAPPNCSGALCRTTCSWCSSSRGCSSAGCSRSSTTPRPAKRSSRPA